MYKVHPGSATSVTGLGAVYDTESAEGPEAAIVSTRQITAVSSFLRQLPGHCTIRAVISFGGRNLCPRGTVPR